MCRRGPRQAADADRGIGVRAVEAGLGTRLEHDPGDAEGTEGVESVGIGG